MMFDSPSEIEQPEKPESSYETSSGSTQYLIAEGNLIKQRGPHFCCENKLKMFRTLIRLDSAELF